jgi:hypothetical protein
MEPPVPSIRPLRTGRGTMGVVLPLLLVGSVT